MTKPYIVEARRTFRIQANSEKEALEKATDELTEMVGVSSTIFSLLVANRVSWGYNIGFLPID